MKNWQTFLYVLASLVLLLSISWIIAQPSFESVITFIGALVSIGGLLTKNNAEDFHKLQRWTTKNIRLLIFIGGIIIFVVGVFIGMAILAAPAISSVNTQATKPAQEASIYATNQVASEATSVYVAIVNEKLSLENLTGEWQTYWNSELVIVSIPQKPAIGEIAGTVGYLYQEEQYHCGIDIWYAGMQGTSQIFNVKNKSEGFAPILDKVLPSCEKIGIKPFSRYEITVIGEKLFLKQFENDIEVSSTELQSVTK